VGWLARGRNRKNMKGTKNMKGSVWREPFVVIDWIPLVDGLS
jgi:hypothetical protein